MNPTFFRFPKDRSSIFLPHPSQSVLPALFFVHGYFSYRSSHDNPAFASPSNHHINESHSANIQFSAPFLKRGVIRSPVLKHPCRLNSLKRKPEHFYPGFCSSIIISSLRSFQNLVLTLLHQRVHRRYLAVRIILVL